MTGFSSFLRSMWRDMWSQKLRTVMTTFGIVWGTVAVALLLSVGHGLQTSMIKSYAGMGDRIVIAFPGLTSIPFEGLGRGRRIQMQEGDIDYLRAQVPELAAISSDTMQDMQIVVGDNHRSVNVSGVKPSYGLLRNMIPTPGGRFINPIDVRERRRVAFIGDGIAGDLFGDEDPVGREVTLHGSPFLIVGVLKHKSQDSSYGPGQDTDKVVIPATTFRALTGRQNIDVFVFRGHTAEGNVEVTGRVVEALAARKRFDPADNGALTLWDTTEMFVMFNALILGFNVFLGMMGVITLTVGGIGVSNIMNVVVEERTREIGIKLALGARPRAIMGGFLMETLVVTAMGGLIGVAITAGICSLFSNPSQGLAEMLGRPEFSPGVGAITAAFLGVVGLVAGYFPARDAARLDPVVAMKL